MSSHQSGKAGAPQWSLSVHGYGITAIMGEGRQPLSHSGQKLKGEAAEEPGPEFNQMGRVDE